MKIYTKTGDTGTTSLASGERVPKTCARLQAYGTIDELNSFLGLLKIKIDKQFMLIKMQRLKIMLLLKFLIDNQLTILLNLD